MRADDARPGARGGDKAGPPAPGAPGAPLNRGSQINWNQVYYFSEIAETGSVKAAAEKLDLSSSTLSEHLSQLEEDLGVKLFQRQHRRLALTQEGARIYQCARQMFDTGKRFIDAVSPTPLGCYPTTIGLVPGSGYTFAHKIIGDYVSRHRDVSVHVLRYQHDELEAAMLEAKLDFGFTDRRSERRDIVQKVVVESDLRFFVSQSLPKVALAELFAQLPLVLCRTDRRVPSAIEEVLDSLDLRPRNLVVSDYPSLVERLCREGAGVAVLGHAHLRNDPTVRMVDLPRDFPDFKERLYATWVQGAENSEMVTRLKPLLG